MSEVAYNPMSILDSTKKQLPIEVEDTDFDDEVINYINGVFPFLITMGVSDLLSFRIIDRTSEWSDFVKDLGDKTESLISLVDMYMFLKVKLLFDPPASSSAIKILEGSIKEYSNYIIWKVEDED